VGRAGQDQGERAMGAAAQAAEDLRGGADLREGTGDLALHDRAARPPLSGGQAPPLRRQGTGSSGNSMTPPGKRARPALARVTLLARRSGPSGTPPTSGCVVKSLCPRRSKSTGGNRRGKSGVQKSENSGLEEVLGGFFGFWDVYQY